MPHSIPVECSDFSGTSYRLALTLTIIISAAQISRAQAQFSASAYSSVSADIIADDRETDPTDRLKHTDAFTKHPLNINTATLGDLLSLPYISFDLASAIIIHRQTIGPFVRSDELLDSTQFKQSESSLLIPFIVTGFEPDTAEYDQVRKEKSKIFFLMRDSFNPEKIRSDSYPGSLHSTSGKAGYYDGENYSCLAQFAKDAGEENYLDFFSFNIHAKNKFGLKDILLGDFYYDFGKGLLSSAPYFKTKGPMLITNLRKGGEGLQPYTGSLENRFYRGAAVGFEMPGLAFQAFASSKYIDGMITPDARNTEYLFFSGLHRTKNELSAQNNIALTDFGIAASKGISENLLLKILLLSEKMSPPIESAAGNINTFSGSLYFDGFYKRYLFNGELVYFQNGFSAQSNFIVDITAEASFALSIRNYQARPGTVNIRALGEYGGSEKETGVLFAYEMKDRQDFFTVFLDFFNGKPLKAKAADEYYGSRAGITWRRVFAEVNDIHCAIKYYNHPLENTAPMDAQHEYKFQLQYNFRPSGQFNLSLRSDIDLAGSGSASVNLSGMLLSLTASYRLLPELSIEWRVYGFSKGGLYHDTETESGGDYYFYSFNKEGFRYYLSLSSQVLAGLKIAVKTSVSENGYTGSSAYKKSGEVTLKAMWSF